MLILTKILTSAITIVLITEIAKRNTGLGGLIAVLPINIILSLIWLYIEKKDLILLAKFSLSAFIGIFPTILFLIILSYLFNRNIPFFFTLIICIFFLFFIIYLQNKFIKLF